MLKCFFFGKDSPSLTLSQDIRNCITGPQGRYANLILPTKLGLTDSTVVLVINDYHAQFGWTPGKTEVKYEVQDMNTKEFRDVLMTLFPFLFLEIHRKIPSQNWEKSF